MTAAVDALPADVKAQVLSKVRSFRKIARDEMTGAVANVSTARLGSCNKFVAIECRR